MASAGQPVSNSWLARAARASGAVLLAVLLWISASPAGARGSYYTVQRAETVAALGSRLGVSPAELARANRLGPTSTIAPGTRLWVPNGTPGPSSPTPQRPVIRTSPSSQRPSPSPPTRRQLPVIDTSAPEARVYTVRPGDSLWAIANRHGLTVDDLARNNGIDPARPLRVGQRLVVSGSLPSRQQPPAPSAVVRDVPGGAVTVDRAAPARPQGSSDPARASRHGFSWPVTGRVIRGFTNRSDEKYTGIDIATPRGTEVRAAKDGLVVYAGDGIPFYGNMVIVDHANDLATVYAQNSRLLVREGQRVKRGQAIARSGGGSANAEPYLHFEIRRGGDAIDPQPYLP